ncbi:hypothetical protein BH10PSE19_BH10PSE19_08710 [soil metagenome]
MIPVHVVQEKNISSAMESLPNSSAIKPIHVVVGIIYNSQGEVLIALRPEDRYLGGLWEFPGGKVEVAESAFKALQRELDEELGITVVQAIPLMQQTYSYPEMVVNLDVWRVEEYLGEPWGKEGQTFRWAKLTELRDIEFPHGNEAIIDLIVS